MLRVEDERARGEGRESFFGAGTPRELSPGNCRTRSTRHEGAEALLAGLQLGGRLRGGGQGEEEAQRTDGGGGALVAGKATWPSPCNQGGNAKELGKRVVGSDLQF